MAKKAKWCYIICSVLFCVLGLCLIVFPTISALTLCYFIGGLSVAYGVTKIFGYFSHDLYNLAFQFDLALGIFVTILGMIFLVHPEGLIAIFPILIGIFVMIDGVFKLQTSFDAKRFGLKEWWLILLGAILSIVLSALLVFDPFAGSDVLMIMIGISLLADGLQNLFNAIYTVKILKRENKNGKTYINVDDYEVK